MTIALLLFLSCEAPLFQIPVQEDTSPPLITLINPANNETVFDTVLVEIFAQDNDGVSSVELFLNDSSVIVMEESPYQWEWNTFEYPEDQTVILSAKATDRKDNTNQTKSITVMVNNIEDEDLINPTGTILHPFTGQSVEGIVSITVDAGDNDAVESVKIFINDILEFTGNTSPYQYDWNTINLEEDAFFTIYALIRDLSGNESSVGPISVLVDNIEPVDDILPAGTLTHPPASATLSGLVPIQVSASDNEGVAFVQFFINGNMVSQDDSSPYEYDWNTQNETEDTNHIIGVLIQDTAGNEISLTPVTVFVDNILDDDIIAPIVFLSEPIAGESVSGLVNITAIAYDERGIASLEFYLDNILIATISSEPYVYEWNTENETEDSDIIVFAKAFDTSGNATQTQPIPVTVDNEDNIYPTGSIIYPYAGQSVSGIVNIQVSADDNIGISAVSFSIAGSEIGTASQYPYAFNWDTNSYSEDQEHIISVSVTDSSNNTTQLQTVAVIVDNQ